MGGKFFHNCIKGFACLAIALFVMANKPCFATSIPGSFEFGVVSSTGVSDSFETEEALNIFELCDIGASTVTSRLYSSSEFSYIVESIGLDTYFFDWNPLSPSFYVNVYCLRNTSGYTEYILDFRKDSFSTFNFSTTVFSNNVLVSNTLGFPSIYTSSSDITLLSLPKNYYLPFSNNSSDPFLSGFTYGSGTFVSGGATYPYIFQSKFYGDLLNDFSDFLSSSSYYSFTIICHKTSSGSVDYDYSVNLRLDSKLTSSTVCVLSTFYVYKFSSSVSFYNKIYQNPFTYYFYTVSGSSPSDIYNLGEPYTLGLRLSWRDSSLPSPTPIPPWRDSELPTPTAYPSVTVAPLPTGIVTDFIPLLDLPSTENTLANITGIIKEFNSVFGRKVFALGSYMLQVMYYFSGWFKFIFLVPAGVFIAFLIGRLRKK